MKNPSPRRPPQYRLRGKRPDLPSNPVNVARWRWLGAGVGVVFLLAVVLGLIWVVLSGAGTNRWILQPGSPTPLPTRAPAVSISPTVLPVTQGTKTGTISGNVGYPAATAPAQKICAENIADASVTYCTEHAAGNTLDYRFDVPVGTYYVYASLLAAQGDYTTSYRAYYNQYVACQKIGNCAAGLHNKYMAVPVTADATISDVDPTDWYALGVGQ